jgi:hypothetical protein
MIKKTKTQNGYMEMVAIVIDGGHFSYAMNEAIDRYAIKNDVNYKNIHVSINMLLGKIERELNIKFDAGHKFFYQGTDTGKPNDFHKKLEEQYGMHVGVHSMKKQGGKPTSPPYSQQQQLTIKVPETRSIVLEAEAVNNSFSLFKIACTPFFYVGRHIVSFVRSIGSCVRAGAPTEIVTTEIAPTVSANVNKKVYIKVERGVDVQIATKIFECAHGVIGMSKCDKIVVITGDADFETAFLSASHVTEVIVISQSSGLSPFLAKYLPKQCHINIDELMESCISVNYFVKPHTTHSISPKNHLNIAPTLNVPPPPPPPLQCKQNDEYSNETDQSLEVATLLHHFIATKHKDKPFFSVEMALFYNDGNESLKPYVQKVKIKSICDKWPSLLETATYCPKGLRIMLSNSDRSTKLIKGYFSQQCDFNALQMPKLIAPALEIVIAPVPDLENATVTESFILLSSNLNQLSNDLDENLNE